MFFECIELVLDVNQKNYSSLFIYTWM